MPTHSAARFKTQIKQTIPGLKGKGGGTGDKGKNQQINLKLRSTLPDKEKAGLSHVDIALRQRVSLEEVPITLRLG